MLLLSSPSPIPSAALRAAVFTLGVATSAAEPLHSVPEPMVFDLVRPLGARRGELEVNTLAQRTERRGAPWAWAPEVEYAFANGYSAELEFPFEDGSLRQYKAALQGTIGTAAGERFIHGWQAIGRLNRNESAWSADTLYLTGYRINAAWSVFSMQGVRRTKPGGAAQWAGIYNPSVFRTLSRHWTAGLETNLVLGGPPVRQALVMPQIQIQSGTGWILQAGAGVEVAPSAAARPAFALRLTKVIR
jgi:hypothetical protein